LVEAGVAVCRYIVLGCLTAISRPPAKSNGQAQTAEEHELNPALWPRRDMAEEKLRAAAEESAAAPDPSKIKILLISPPARCPPPPPRTKPQEQPTRRFRDALPPTAPVKDFAVQIAPRTLPLNTDKLFRKNALSRSERAGFS
jgi:hypothetical protein